MEVSEFWGNWSWVDLCCRAKPKLRCMNRTITGSGAAVASYAQMPSLLGRFLRHAETGQWLTKDGRLSYDENEAYPVGTTAAAIDLCRQLRLEGMELVLKFDNSAYNVSMPIVHGKGED